MKGSKSFSLAAHLFPKETREAAFCLYAWCRYCDDEIDTAIHADKFNRMSKLIQQTEDCFSDHPQTHPVFQAFQFVVQRYNVPKIYPMELLQGMAMDVRGDRHETLDDLKLYCYRVAGTVGLMMSHIMGISEDWALNNACDMGVAMQLTNIARDIREDFEMGRVYLPLSWMREAGIPPHEIMNSSYRRPLVNLVKRLLDEADRYYSLGDAGLPSLSFRMACTIAAARGVYSQIGKEVASRGNSAWESRTVVSWPRKLAAMIKRVVLVVKTGPSRVLSPWRPKPIRRTLEPVSYIK